MAYDDALTRNNDGELAMRVVSSTEGSNPSSYDDVFTRDTNGKLAMRVVGAGGGDSHNKGHYATPQALEEAYPTASAGDFATVESTDTIWLWDNDDGEWVDSHKADSVTSVNGQTGAVVLDAEDVGALPADTPIPDPQIQSDWGQTDTEAVDYIKNKPTIPTTAQQVGAIPQYSTMPTPSSSNVGELAQYNGTTIPDAEASAVATQTVGSGLSDLSVNVDTFEGVEQPSGVETVDFTAIVTQDSVVYDPDKVSDPNSYLMTRIEEMIGTEGIYIVIGSVDENNVATSAQAFNQTGGFFTITEQDLVDNNVVISNVAVSDTIYLTFIQGSTTWEKDSETVDISAYGVSFTGTPSNGDVLTVSYTPFVEGITNGYFYKSSVEYSDPTATISQTVGSGLSDLSVNVDTFIEAEQPTQDETVAFVASVIAEHVSPTTFSLGGSVFTIDSSVLIQACKNWVYQGNWGIVNSIRMIYNAPISRFDISVDTSDGEFRNNGINPSDYGISYDSLPIDFEYEQRMTYYPDTTTWEKDSESVDLSAYGISYSGTPNDGDTLTVAYTAPALIGYAWKQTDVQPSSGGGNAGIEWKTKVDLPAEYAGDQYNAAPYYTIVGGLPDGEYEFYFSTKLLSNDSSQPVMIGEVLYKMKLRINNNDSSFSGVLGYVFNGDYVGSMNSSFGYGRTWWSYVYKNDNDLILYQTERPFTSDALAYNGVQAVPECFKLSAIKNVETGQEYIAVGNINLDGSSPSYTTGFNGTIKINRLVDEPSMPDPTATRVINIDNMATQTFQFPLPQQFGVFNMKHAESNSEFVVVWTAQYGGNSGRVPYSQQIIKATGAFANCHLENNKDYIYVMGVDTAAVALLTGSVKATLGGIMSGSEAVWVTNLPQNTTMIQQVGPQGYKLGTITADCVGNIIQYTGATDANYTNGYWYKANGTVVTSPESIVLTPQDPEFSIIVNSVSNLKSAIQNLTGWGDSYIEEQFANGFQWVFDISFDSGESSTVNYANFSFWGSSDPSILSCFTVTYTGSDQGTREVYCSETYTPESKSVQNPSWDRIDVQPQPTPTIPATMPTLVQTDWSVQGEQTINVTGVTAGNVVMVGPAPASAAEYNTCGVLCTAQGNGTLTFTCTSTPANDLTVNVVIL